MLFFFFNDTATTEIYTLSLHDALPICFCRSGAGRKGAAAGGCASACAGAGGRGVNASASARGDRKSTRLNSSHGYISYAVFCLKKKKLGIRRRACTWAWPFVGSIQWTT